MSDIVFSPAVLVIINAIAVTASLTTWYILPLARRRAVEPSRGVELRATRRPDAA